MRLLVGTFLATTALTVPAFAQTASPMDYTTATCAEFTTLSSDDQMMAFQDLQAEATAGMTANADATGDAASTDMTADAGATSTDAGAASTDTASTDMTADAGAASTDAASTDMTADAGATSTDTGAASTDMSSTDMTQTADAATSGTDSAMGADTSDVTGTESTAADTYSTGTEAQDPMLTAILASCEGNPDQLVIDAAMQVMTDMDMSNMDMGTATTPTE